MLAPGFVHTVASASLDTAERVDTVVSAEVQNVEQNNIVAVVNYFGIVGRLDDHGHGQVYIEHFHLSQVKVCSRKHTHLLSAHKCLMC